MAINAYCGVMGSGKSYEVVSGPLLEAVANGRRVVTNIDGVNEHAIHTYLSTLRGLDTETLGRVVHVTTDAIRAVDFFPVENESSAGATVVAGFVQSGDLVVVDEAWKLWASDCKIPKEHLAFFRMHRHFVHEASGVACDVVMMVQSISDLHRMLKPVIELSFRMVKLKAVGAPTKYRVEMYEGSRQNKTTRTGTFIRSYRREIFPLYRSYAGGLGKEVVVDKRQNILGNKVLWFYATGVVLLILVGVWAISRFFHSSGSKAGFNRAPSHLLSSGVSSVDRGEASVTAVESIRPSTAMSDTWRVSGEFSAEGVRYVVLVDGSGRMRVDSPGSYVGVGSAVVGRVDGQRVSMWSGAIRTPLPSVVPPGVSK